MGHLRDREDYPMAIIERRRSQNGTISYRVKVQTKGQPSRSATFTKYQDARAWSQRQEAQAQERRYFPERSTVQYTFNDLLQRYCRDVLPPRLTDTPSESYYTPHLVGKEAR